LFITVLINWRFNAIYFVLCAVKSKTMIGKKVKYKDKIYKVAQWIHYRLEWFEVEFKDHNGYHKFLLKESDVVIL